jgi:hypothetical protein
MLKSRGIRWAKHAAHRVKRELVKSFGVET